VELNQIRLSWPVCSPRGVPVTITGLRGRSRSRGDQKVNERMDVERLSRIDRVNIIGTSGSGKSTFGRKLAAALELPFYEMDQLYWLPDWQEPEDAEFLPQVEAVVSQRAMGAGRQLFANELPEVESVPVGGVAGYVTAPHILPDRVTQSSSQSVAAGSLAGNGQS
jgi:hypothetical protein